ncbi:hypothetical protein APY04_2807 [Hyphomicrobium sulfonivorans]|uniref:Uncharacterized protein n=1 Tax=Hyphomicrobium sulfonivorans TaxID=121290 RepID=A0A120CU12_HYPSL|nr:hypothetical protein APY04_2807 [Hyphomicrobium sulfonivorans]
MKSPSWTQQSKQPGSGSAYYHDISGIHIGRHPTRHGHWTERG